MTPEILVIRCGLMPYEEGEAVQSWLVEARQADEIPDTLLLLEHSPVYTRGRRSTEDELPLADEWYEAQGIEVRDTDRGGRVTYHGPGQLVIYPIVSLKEYDDDVHEYVRRLERLAIGSLADHGVTATTIEGLTGVWVPGDSPDAEALPANGATKIGSIGVHVSRGVTSHGMAINVSNDLEPFKWVVPCGLEDCRVTSLSAERGSEQSVEEFATTLTRHYGEIFGRRPVDTAPEALGLDRAKLGTR